MENKRMKLLIELLNEALAHAPLPEGPHPYSGPAHLSIKETIEHLKAAEKITSHYESKFETPNMESDESIDSIMRNELSKEEN